MICLKCKKETKNPKFCSRSCSVSYNNLGVRRHGKNSTTCPDCGSVKDLKAKLCRDCKNKKTLERVRNSPISKYKLGKSASRARWNSVRKWARKEMELSKKRKECAVCKWDIYVEVCHIVPIQDFSEDALMGVVNSTDKNLEYLCPNHHKMLDIGLLEL